MGIEFSIVLNNENRMEKVLNDSKQYFNIDYIRRGKQHTTLIESDNILTLRFNKKLIDVNVFENNLEIVKDRVEKVAGFIDKYIQDEVISICYIRNDYNIKLLLEKEINMIELM